MGNSRKLRKKYIKKENRQISRHGGVRLMKYGK